MDWERFCIEQGATPLFIELNALTAGQLQLMCEIEDQESFDDFTKALAAHEEFKVIRIKHEVQTLKRGEVPLYYEAHVKFDGPYRPDLRGASRDLYRLQPSRWYVTRRGAGAPVLTDIRTVQGDGKPDLVEAVTVYHAPFSTDEVKANLINLEVQVDGPGRRQMVGVDAEWVLVDTNPGLDQGWL